MVVSLRSLLYTNPSSLPITVEQICVIIKILFVVNMRKAYKSYRIQKKLLGNYTDALIKPRTNGSLV